MKNKTNTTWTLRDVMRKAHPKGIDPAVGNFILNGEVSESSPAIIKGFKAVQAAKTKKQVLAVLSEYKNLPWETIPTQFLKETAIWEALFYNGALNGQALLRNVTRLARIGAFDDMKFAADYAARLSDEKNIEKGRVHPLSYLNALVVHQDGQVKRDGYNYYYARRNKDWNTNSKIAAGLEDGFYKAFKHVEPANARTFIGLDVSGSMASMASGLDLSCAQVGAAMAMTVARTEPYSQVMGFTTANGSYWRSDTQMTDLGITEKMDLNTVMKQTEKHNFGGTDCALPMVYALKNKIKVEHFIVITDNETWAGNIKPVQALDAYKSKMGIDARLSVVALSGGEFSIADANRNDMLDVVGGDANLPRLLADFGGKRV